MPIDKNGLTMKEVEVKAGLSKRWSPGVANAIWVLYLSIKKGEKKVYSDLSQSFDERRYADILRINALIQYSEVYRRGRMTDAKLILRPD